MRGKALKLYLRENSGVMRPMTAATSGTLLGNSSSGPRTVVGGSRGGNSISDAPLGSTLTSPSFIGASSTLGSTASSSASPFTLTFSGSKPLAWKKMSMLGKGSFGTVYEGITSDGKIMAVKVQDLPADENSDSDDVKSLMSEINLMKQLNHKNIVAYFGCQTTSTVAGGRQMEIFLEFCSGGTLSTIRKRFDATNGRLSIPLIRSYTKQILEGLLYLHRKGVMHRDIKSDNVLISATGEAKLADFGCSKRIGTTTLAGSGGQPDAALYQTMVGTPLFMAPEVMNDVGPGYTNSADIWSVGCLIIELMGSKPWLVQGTNLFQVMFQISQCKDMPTGVPKDTPPQLLDFLRSCFERDASKRGTAEQLLKHPWITADEDALEDYTPL
mmetsp:Transcript_58370/g.67404  ORF Transcript_58370/g.67404 Transcript_58370/m.67404 type:complete len:385 (+) Transcript_58370:398-1552(+)